MSCQHCHKHQCTTSVVLIDGRQVCSWSEDWRHECEARHVLSFSTLMERRQYLYGKFERVHAHGRWIEKCTSPGIKQKRGDEALAKMEATMTAIWKLRAKAA